MRARVPFVFGVLIATTLACTQQTSSARANLIGTHDLVLVDDPGSDELLAATSNNPDGGLLLVAGVPSRFLYVTSADTNELRILENYQPGLVRRDFVRAPNPLEALSIPVLDRPTMLAADEGRNAEGTRVTGSYVYAARPGGAEVSVVSIARRRQLGGKPIPTPAPVTAIGAFMDVDQTRPALQTPRPATTRLFVATWDGAVASVYAAELPTNSPELDRLDFKRLVLIDQTPITALLVVPPWASRTLDGAAFCATRACLALATREGAGRGGETILFEPETGRSAHLSFSGPVRDLTSAADVTRIYGILDEQACGGPSCGGVVAVDLAAGTSASGFPGARDALGLPMAPLRSEGLITGLTIASGGTVRQTVETGNADGGSSGLAYLLQDYRELGAFSSSNGVITFFSGLAGSLIDFDARRSTVTAASVRTPGQLSDGGASLIAEDGGSLGTLTAATVVVDEDLTRTWRTAAVTVGDGSLWTVDVSDGYLQTQSVVVVNQGRIPGLVSLPTTAADGVRLATGGLEVRAAAGDVVLFETGNETDGYRDCGRSQVASVGAGFVEVPEVPAGCVSRSRFSVRAGGLKPLVAAGDVEGYLGRWAPGETLTYNRPYVLLPAEVTGSRTALTLIIPPVVPAGEGAFIAFDIVGHITPLQVSLDTTTIGCYTQLPGQVVLGNLVMAQVPTAVTGQAAIDFRWTLFGVVPSGNGLAEITQTLTRVAPLGAADGANCWR